MATRHYFRNEVVNRQGYAAFLACDAGTDATAQDTRGAGSTAFTFELYKRASDGSTGSVLVSGTISHTANSSVAVRTTTFTFPATDFAAMDAIQLNMQMGGFGGFWCTPQMGRAVSIGSHTATFGLKFSTNASNYPTVYIGAANSYFDYAFDPFVAVTAEATADAPASIISQNSIPDESRFTATNIGTGVDLLWATDPAIASITAHTIWRDGAFLATVNAPGVYYHDANGVAGSVYRVQAVEGGLSFVATAKALTTLSVDSATTTAVALSWTTVTGATGYRLYRAPWGSHQRELRYELYADTGTSHTDSDPLDGKSQYLVVAEFADGQTSESAPQYVTLILTEYISPPERDLMTHYDENLGVFVCGHDIPTNTQSTVIDNWNVWLEDQSETTWMLANLPRSFSKYATVARDFTVAQVETIPLMRVRQTGTLAVLARGEFREITNGVYSWNGSTGWVQTPLLKVTLDMSAATALLTVNTLFFESTATMAVLNLGAKIGGTDTTLGAFTTKTLTTNPISGEHTLELEKVVSGVTCHFTVLIKDGTTDVSGYMSGHGASDQLWVRETQNTTNQTAYSTHGITQLSVGSGDNRAEPTGRICLLKKTATLGTWSFATGYARTVFGGLGNGVVDGVAKCWFGQEPYPASYHGYIPIPSIDSVCIGGPILPSRVLLGAVAWLEKHPTDTTAKAETAALIDAVNNSTVAMATQFTQHEQGLCLWALTRMAATYPSEGWEAKRDALASTLGDGYSTGALESAAAAYGLRTYGDSASATTALDRATINASDPQFILGYALMGRPDHLDTTGLLWLSYLLRGMRSQTDTHWNGDIATVWGTGEAIGWCTAALGRYAASLGGTMPLRVGRGAYSVQSAWMVDAYKASGTITALSWNAGTNTLTVAADEDVWLYTGSRNKPNAVKRSSGSVTLTETATDPGEGTMTVDYWYFDDTTNVLKVGVTSAQTLTIELPAVTFALSATGVDTQGCTLDHTIYSAADFTSYKLWRSTTSNIDGTGSDVLLTVEYDSGVNTYHDTGANPGTVYYYRVELVTTGGSVWSDEETATTPRIAALFLRNFILFR